MTLVMMEAAIMPILAEIASTRKSLNRAWRPELPRLSDFNRPCETDESHRLDKVISAVPEAERYSRCKENCQVFKIMSHLRN